ncbi:MAG: HWE histidine kinase domain-containing protein [Caulobacteraceae bacterium]|nr:HWE histidine kinase domain-containing protein [Caulobacteraceae bacterium]
MSFRPKLFVQPRKGRGWPLAVGLGLAYAILAVIAYAWTLGAGGLAILWPCNGILAAGLLLLPRGKAITLAVACMAIDCLSAWKVSGGSPLLAVVISGGDVTEAVLAALLIRRVGGAALDVTDLNRLRAITLFGVLPATLTIGTVGSLIGAWLFQYRLATIWPQWALGDFLGMMIGLPTSLILSRWRRFDVGGTERPLERIVILAMIAVATVLFFVQDRSPLSFLLFPVIVLSTFRLSPPYMVLSVLTLAILAALLSIAGFGPFAIREPRIDGGRFLALQAFLTATLVTAVVPMAALADRERTQIKLTRALGASQGAKRHAEEAVDTLGRVVKLQRLMVNELNHRVKNTLASVQSVASQTLRNSRTLAEARTTLDQRLLAMARAHDILTRESWEGADLADLLRTAVDAHAADGLVRIQGPAVRLSPKAALALSLSFHELCTNAMKYGALSGGGAGRVDVDWTVRGAALRLVWRESGGPPVRTPQRKGFGSRMLHSMGRELNGQARIDYDPKGLVCTITARMDEPTAEAREGVDA